jgi:hypothetical protein
VKSLQPVLSFVHKVTLSLGVGALLTAALGFAQVQGPGASPPPEPARKQPAAKPENEDRDVPAPAQKIQVGGAVEPTLEDRIQQLTETYRHVLVSELHFIRSTCRLTAGQRSQIAGDAGKLLTKTVDTAAKMRIAHKPGGAQARLAPLPDRPDPLARLQQGLADIVKARVAPEQWARYQDETATRSAHRKQVVIRILVAKLDGKLFVSPLQRDQLSASLSSHWSDAWLRQSFAIFSDSDDQFPQVPDQHITPFLTKTQKEFWLGSEKPELEDSSSLAEIMGQLMEGLPSEFDDLPGQRPHEPDQAQEPKRPH